MVNLTGTGHFWEEFAQWDHIKITTAIIRSRFKFSFTEYVCPPVNNGHYFWVTRVVVVHWFDETHFFYNDKSYKYKFSNRKNKLWLKKS